MDLALLLLFGRTGRQGTTENVCKIRKNANFCLKMHFLGSQNRQNRLQAHKTHFRRVPELLKASAQFIILGM